MTDLLWQFFVSYCILYSISFIWNNWIRLVNTTHLRDKFLRYEYNYLLRELSSRKWMCGNAVPSILCSATYSVVGYGLNHIPRRAQWPAMGSNTSETFANVGTTTHESFISIGWIILESTRPGQKLNILFTIFKLELKGGRFSRLLHIRN